MTVLKQFKSIEELEAAIVSNREEIKNLSDKFEKTIKPKEVKDETTKFEEEFYGIEVPEPEEPKEPGTG